MSLIWGKTLFSSNEPRLSKNTLFLQMSLVWEKTLFSPNEPRLKKNMFCGTARGARWEPIVIPIKNARGVCETSGINH